MKVGIAGAGILGRLLAHELAARDIEVTVFEQSARDHHNSCSYAAAGMLSPIAELETSDSVVFDLGVKSLQRWPDILKRLDDSVFWQQQGSLITAHPNDQADLDFTIDKIKQRGEVEIQTLLNDEVKQLEPELTSDKAYFFPQEAQVHTGELMQALLDDQRVTYQFSTPVSSVKYGEIQTAEKTHSFDWVFDCRGLGAKQVLKNMRGVRGELIHVHAPDVTITRPVRLLHPRYRIYIVPRPQHEYLIGATEIDSEDHSEISVRSMMELLSAAYSVHAGFGEARVIKTVTHCRPALPDNNPVIKHGEKSTAINGLYRHGFLLAPALVDAALSEVLQ